MKYTLLFLLFAISAGQAQINPLWTRYPAISPDGSRIVFSYKGDLYIVGSTGGSALQLTSNPAYDFNPVWSNDGKTIAFASDRFGNFDVYTIPPEGGEVNRITYHSNGDIPTAFTPDNSQILFSSLRQDPVESALFPSGVLSELYGVPVSGGRNKQILPVTAENAQMSEDGSIIVYQDRKGYEDPWRKHHTSYVTRDIWKYDVASGKHSRIVNFLGEDRNPVLWGKTLYYLSEQGGTMNVWQCDLQGANAKQITQHEIHPVRFLTAAKNGTLCYFYNGHIYLKAPGAEAKAVPIQLAGTDKINDSEKMPVKDKATEIALSPNGKEIAFVVRGEVYVTSIDHSVTKRITNTPNQERNISFSPDGKKLLYASERNGSWNIYETALTQADETYFFLSTVLKEKALVETSENTFQPAYSPDGKEIAYLRERTAIDVKTLEGGKVRNLLPTGINYSYSDGDQHFKWSPDGKWIATQILDNNRWVTDVAIIATDGKGKPINLTQSGYGEASPMWMNDGNVLLFFSDRNGRRAQASWGSDYDVYAIYLNRETYDKFELRPEEYEIKYGKSAKKDEKKDKETDKESEKQIKPIKIDTVNIEDRIKRLTIHSSDLSGAILSKEGDKLYYLSRFEKGYDLWSQDLIKKETKLVVKLNGDANGFEADEKTENLYVLDNGNIFQIDINGKGEKKSVAFSSVLNYRPYKEREYMFDHAWRQVKEKFYVTDLHGVDWDLMKENYRNFLPHISNGYDFAELLSEMLGELNASHTGARYRELHPQPDQTASLGILMDLDYTGAGIKIIEVLKGGPFDHADSKVAAGHVITSINGKKIEPNTDIYQLLNGLSGSLTLVSIEDPKSKTNWKETIRPISLGEENNMLYERWVRRNQAFTEKYSKGRIAYVHVRGMNENSYRTIYSELMGKYHDYDGAVIDTRFNGGGWLHDDLATFLNGRAYMKFSPRGQENMGSEPMFKWKQPSIVLMSEGNYSDAHMFPYVYKALNIGKLVGMPVAGTGTAVWWERQIDGQTVFGIPQVGMKGTDGKYLENQELMPDIRIENDPANVNEDKQLKAAIDELLITGSRDH